MKHNAPRAAPYLILLPLDCQRFLAAGFSAAALPAGSWILDFQDCLPPCRSAADFLAVLVACRPCPARLITRFPVCLPLACLPACRLPVRADRRRFVPPPGFWISAITPGLPAAALRTRFCLLRIGRAC